MSEYVKLASGGHLHEAEMLALLRSGAHPSRNPEQNLGDLKAQIAANEKGVQELRKMVAHFGLDVVKAYMRHVQDNAEECVRRRQELREPIEPRAAAVVRDGRV